MRENTNQVSSYLQRIPLFTGLSDASIVQRLRDERCLLKSYSAQELILSYDKPTHWLGVLLQGEANVYKMAGEARILMSVLPAGSLLGAATLFMADARAATLVQAKKSCKLLQLEETLLEEWMQKDFVLTRNYLSYLTTRIHFLTHRIEEVACPSVADRVMNYFVQHAQNGSLTLPQGMNALAQTLCISRASLYRVLEQLISEKKIKRDGKKIYVIQGEITK